MALCVTTISPSWGAAGTGLREQLRPKELRASEQKKKKTCKAGRRGEGRGGVLGLGIVCEASQEEEQERSRGASAAIWQQPPAEIVKILGQKVWGRKLPPGALVAVVREVWSSGWHTMMAQLAPSDEQKGFKRLDSQFRNRPITPAQSGRYHLYAAFTCPWAHRWWVCSLARSLACCKGILIGVILWTVLWKPWILSIGTQKLQLFLSFFEAKRGSWTVCLGNSDTIPWRNPWNPSNHRLLQCPSTTCSSERWAKNNTVAVVAKSHKTKDGRDDYYVQMCHSPCTQGAGGCCASIHRSAWIHWLMGVQATEAPW